MSNINHHPTILELVLLRKIQRNAEHCFNDIWKGWRNSGRPDMATLFTGYKTFGSGLVPMDRYLFREDLMHRPRWDTAFLFPSTGQFLRPVDFFRQKKFASFERISFSDLSYSSS
jgi:hypothetical protein